MIKPELLAPAGDLERLKWAIDYGADAVYFGGPGFGLRANAVNFTFDDINEAVKYAHERKKRVYVTVNIVLHDKEALELEEYLKKLESLGVDAIIVSDPAVIKLAHEKTSLEIHLSTQQSTLNKKAVEFFKNEGVTRIVLGRETSKEEIKEIIDSTDIEIECFIHGAMCAGYSGRCVLSNFLTKRDANRGGCSQICRWNFDLLDEKFNEIKGDKAFSFCTKDLSMIECIPEMIDMGITSLKIEGRMRSIYYIATVVSIYRKVIDEYLHNPKNYTYNESYKRILDNCANRASVVQFFDGNSNYDCQYYNSGVDASNQDFLGVVLDYQDGYAIIEERNFFAPGTNVEIFGPNTDTFSFKIEAIYDQEGKQKDAARHPEEIVKIKVPEKVFKNDIMRLKRV